MQSHIRHRLARLAGRRPPGRIAPPSPVVDFMDAPSIAAVEACLPVGDTVAIVPSFTSILEESGVASVRLGRATVLGINGQIRQHGVWMMQFSWYAGQTFLPPSYQLPPVPHPTYTRTETIAGPAVSTVPAFGGVYGHVLLDELPMLLWLMEDRARLDRFETVLCTPFALKLLRRTAHPLLDALSDRAHAVDGQTLYDIADLTALRRTGCRMNPSMQEIALLRAHRGPAAEPDAAATPRRLFVDRPGGTRGIRNLDEVHAVLQRHGIACVAPEDLADPWAAFAAADLVIGVSGSNLSDSVFMREGAVLLEIHPSDHIKPYNWNVAGKLGLQYRSLVAPSEVQRGTPIGPGNSPIHLPPEDLDRALQDAIVLLPDHATPRP